LRVLSKKKGFKRKEKSLRNIGPPMAYSKLPGGDVGWGREVPLGERVDCIKGESI